MGKKIWEIWTNRHVNNRRRSSCGYLGFIYARSWVVNQLTIVKNESGKTNSNKANIFLRRGIRDLLVVLVQKKTS